MGKTNVIEETRPAEATLEGPVCQHHWLIETPQGSTSRGRCKRCGEEREFRNSATDHLWEDESGSGYTPWRGMRSVTRSTTEEEDVSVTSSTSGESILV